MDVKRIRQSISPLPELETAYVFGWSGSLASFGILSFRNLWAKKTALVGGLFNVRCLYFMRS